MVSVSILSGIIANEQAEFATTFPLNLEPMLLVDNKIAKGQLRATAGAVDAGGR